MTFGRLTGLPIGYPRVEIGVLLMRPFSRNSACRVDLPLCEYLTRPRWYHSGCCSEISCARLLYDGFLEGPAWWACEDMGPLAGAGPVAACVGVHNWGVSEQLFRVLETEPSSGGGTEVVFAVVAAEPVFGPQEQLYPSVCPRILLLRNFGVPRVGLVLAQVLARARERPSSVGGS